MSFYKLNLKIDPAPLREKLKANPGLFGRNPQRLQGPHREVTDVWVRFNDVKPYLESGDMSGFVDEHESVWYPEAEELPEAKRIIFDIMAHVNGERLGGVLITKLSPGGKVYPHVDHGWHAEYYSSKYYVPIENYKGSTFNFESGSIAPELGEVYQFDNTKLHWVDNNSKFDRLAMVVCIKTDGETL